MSMEDMIGRVSYLLKVYPQVVNITSLRSFSLKSFGIRLKTIYHRGNTQAFQYDITNLRRGMLALLSSILSVWTSKF